MKLAYGIRSDSTDHLPRTFLDINSCATQSVWECDHTMIREKGRNDYQFLYIAKGRCVTTYNGQKYNAPEGSLILFKPHERQEYTFYKKDNSILCYIHFTGTCCEKILEELNLTNHITFVGKSNELIETFNKLENEFMLKEPYYERLCSGIFLDFISLAAKKTMYYQSSANIKSEHSITKVCQYIHLHYKENNPIEFYAEMSNLSVSRFSHVFKEIMGVSPKQYILNAKLEKARHLLETTAASVGEISLEVGFDDANYFSRLMKKYKGISPKYLKKPKAEWKFIQLFCFRGLADSNINTKKLKNLIDILLKLL